MSYETSSIGTTAAVSAVKRLPQRPTPLKSKSLMFSITNKFAPRATCTVAPPSVPSPPTSAGAQQRRGAALRQMGLRPTLTLRQREALDDKAIPILPSHPSPISPFSTALTTEADRIKKDWVSKNTLFVQEREDAQRARLTIFKFGGASSSTPNLPSAAAPAMPGDSGRDSSELLRSWDLPSSSSSLGHESLPSPNRPSISELGKSCEQLPRVVAILSSPTGEVDPSTIPVPLPPLTLGVQEDARSVLLISKSSKSEPNGGSRSCEAGLSPLPSPSLSTTAEGHSPSPTLPTKRVLNTVPPPLVILLRAPDLRSTDQIELESFEVSASTSGLRTTTSLTNLTANNHIPASILAPATFAARGPPFDIEPLHDSPISEMGGDNIVGMKRNRDVVYAEPEMLSASGSRVPSSSGLPWRRSPSAPRGAARSRSASRMRGRGETTGSNLTPRDLEAMPPPSNNGGAVKQLKRSITAPGPKLTKPTPKRSATEDTERKVGVFNRFKRSNTTSAIPPPAGATAQASSSLPLPPLPTKPSVTALANVRCRVISTFGSNKNNIKTCLEPERPGSKIFAASHTSPTCAPSMFRSRNQGPVNPSGGGARGLSLVRLPASPTMHNHASIAFLTNAIEDDETRRMAELAFLS